MHFAALEMADDDVALSVAMYSLLFRIHADRADWKAGLLILDQAVQELPHTQHMRWVKGPQSVYFKVCLGS